MANFGELRDLKITSDEFEKVVLSPGSHDFIGTIGVDGKKLFVDIFTERGEFSLTTKAVEHITGFSYYNAKSPETKVGYQLALSDAQHDASAFLIQTLDRNLAKEIHDEAIRIYKKCGYDGVVERIEESAYAMGINMIWIG